MTTGREAMALMAARLMGSASAPVSSPPQTIATSAPSAAARATIPRDLPEPQPTSRQPPPPTLSTPSGYITSQSNRDVAPPARPAAPVGDGPSLRGTPDQLKEARALQSSMRGGSRDRVLSKAPSAVSRPSAPSVSSRVSGSTGPPASPRPAPSASRAAVGISAGPSHWQAFSTQLPAAAPSPAIRKEDSVLGTASTPNKTLPGQAALPKFDVTFSSPKQQPASPIPKKEENVTPATAAPATMNGKVAAGSIQSWQMKDITNRLNSRASDLPLHKRHVTEIKPEAVSAASPQVVKAETSTPREANSANPYQIAEKAPTNDNQVVTTASSISTAHAATANGLTNGASHHTVESDEILQEIKKEIAAVTKRVSVLEEENLSLQKQVEVVVQTEERRKFLGTDSAMAPFGVDVQGPNGKVIRVQASAGLKVGDLIRRIRTKANLLPADSKDPRVAFGETQLGHGLTLGETGIKQDSVVLFSYST